LGEREKFRVKIFRDSFRAAKFLTRMHSLILRRKKFDFDPNNFWLKLWGGF
jgi:hypothetical protein